MVCDAVNITYSADACGGGVAVATDNDGRLGNGEGSDKFGGVAMDDDGRLGNGGGSGKSGCWFIFLVYFDL